jgi:hypothetical protein
MADTLTSVYSRRVGNEWREACDLEARNTDVIRFTPPRTDGGDTILTVTFCRTPGLVSGPEGLTVRTEHTAELRFPRFYPAVPIEAYLRIPVFHPNVDPGNGFVCLWDRVSPGDTVAAAVLYLHQIIVWRMFNVAAEHVMQPAAAAWHAAGAGGGALPLDSRELRLPEGLAGLESFPVNAVPVRRRLG